MSDENEGMKKYVRQVLDDTNRYLHELLGNIEELGLVLGSLRIEKSQIEAELLVTRNELEQSLEEKTRLEQKLAQIESENRQFSGRYLEVEQQNASLANLYVASFRLHATLDRAEVLSVIQEIIINLIGSEELAIFEVDDNRSALRLVASFGINDESYRSIPLGHGTIGRAASTGKPWLADQKRSDEAPVGESNLTACVPLRRGESTTGAIAIFNLLPQKQGLEQLDHELLDLLSTHAAAALHCTGLQARLDTNPGVTG
ncbi:MAG TPA: GAF domain-containing protein [Blastocatellia bacterium]|nr:GAF domain-containing protein [Blastocatellia bacterium]